MILRLVERRIRPDFAGHEGLAPGTGWELLTGLAQLLGQPDWEVDLVLVGDEAMAALNEEFRKTPGVTDVLSFSYLQESGTGLPALDRGQGHAFTDLWLDTLSVAGENDPAQSVGEVVLAPGFVAERCLRKGWTLENEFPLLVVHGILHLLGWDHASEEEAEAMRAVEEEILAAGGLSHPLRERS